MISTASGDLTDDGQPLIVVSALAFLSESCGAFLPLVQGFSVAVWDFVLFLSLS